MVVAGESYISLVDSLALVVPLTSVDRAWPNHVPVQSAALAAESWAMTEQVRAISRSRITRVHGRVSERALAAIRVWIADFLEL